MAGSGKVGEIKMMDKAYIPRIETIKIKRQISMPATRCSICGKWECPEFNHELYEAIIIGETSGVCKSCLNAVLWAKEQMEKAYER